MESRRESAMGRKMIMKPTHTPTNPHTQRKTDAEEVFAALLRRNDCNMDMGMAACEFAIQLSMYKKSSNPAKHISPVI